MSRPQRKPVALTIAGSDSGGGAGIQADLKTFSALDVHGASVITCITAQNPRRVLGVQACGTEMVRRQLEAVFSELPPAAVKTGMLYSGQIAAVVAKFFEGQQKCLPLVVDPVMVATSGAKLVKPGTVKIIGAELLPLATLVTPNLAEAECLIGKKLRSVEDLRFAAREIRRRFGCAALVKGGHLKGQAEAADIFFDGRNELLLTAPFAKGIHTHGTGCTYSAAIAAYLALGFDLMASVTQAKEFITKAIFQSYTVSGHSTLNCHWRHERAR